MKRNATLVFVLLGMMVSALLARLDRTTSTVDPPRPEHMVWGPGRLPLVYECWLPVHPADVEFPQGDAAPCLNVAIRNSEVSVELVNSTQHPAEYADISESLFVWLELRDYSGRKLRQFHEARDTRFAALSAQCELIQLPTQTRSLRPGEIARRQADVEEFFFMTPDSVLTSPGLQVRGIARAYLDSNLTFYVESVSDWKDLAEVTL